MGQKIITTIGSFDGVHRGHAMLLGQMRDLAQHYGEAELHVVTFSPYPSDVLRPDLRIEHLGRQCCPTYSRPDAPRALSL